MNVTLFMAMTPNGVIARENGDEDFLSHENWKIFCTLARRVGCIIIGRKTHDAVQQWKDYTFDTVQAKKIIVSRKRGTRLGKNCILATSPQDALQKAHAMGFHEVLLTGGGELNSAFMKAGLINEVILNIEPCIVGKGIRVFAQRDFEKKLTRATVKRIGRGIIQLRYLVDR